MKKISLIRTVVFILLGLAWIWFSRTDVQNQQSSLIPAPQEGFLAPDFSLSSITGEDYRLSDQQDKVVIINFWASWCPPCRAEMPDFQQAYQEYGPDRLIILGVNQSHQDSINAVNSFVLQHQLDFPILLDEDGSVGRSYQVHSLPSTFIIDTGGEIRKILIGGPVPLSLLRSELDDLIKEPTNASRD